MVIDGNKIRTLREEAGMTIAELAPIAGVAPTMMGYIETGMRDTTTTVIARIATHFGVKIDDLLKQDT
jgi:DNA-binding XRE family transcriptional regulator